MSLNVLTLNVWHNAGPPLPNGIGLIEACRVVCNDERDGIWPSDHFGPYAELRTEALVGDG